MFVSRCQNLKSEFNDQPWAGKVNDGGFIYTAANGGSSLAGNEPGGGLRSYASMTYAGLKSMIYAGLTADDPRVKAALDYIAKHYTLDENPGLGQKGLYYYYQTFAKAMALLASRRSIDARARVHDWRAELVAALAKRQNPDGSWVNPADRFMEGDPNLVTAYGLLALAYCRDPKSDRWRLRNGNGRGCHAMPERGFSAPPAIMPSINRRPSGPSSRSIRNRIWPSSSPTYSLWGQGQLTGSSWKRGMMCQWPWSIVWPAARPLLTITLRPSAPVAARTARQSRGRSEATCAASGSGSSVRSAWCGLGTSRTCPWLTGWMSRKARASSVSRTVGRGDLAPDDLAEDAIRVVGLVT